MTQTTTQDAYVPGVCNINSEETAYRRKAGHLGLAIFIVLLVVLVLLPVNRWVRLVLILPAILSAIGYLQAKNHFCVKYGATGKQNATEGSDIAADVIIEDALAKDRARARRINQQAVIIGVAAGLLTVLIPHLH